MQAGFLLAALLAFFACIAPGARAEADSCFDKAAGNDAFNECARLEILPLEGKVVSLFNGIRSKYKNDAASLATLDKSEDGWNAYRNSHCTIEAAAGGSLSGIERRRAFARCAKRILLHRIAELELL
jgi:uncharacterized protein YecT (DUF1311 family)